MAAPGSFASLSKSMTCSARSSAVYNASCTSPPAVSDLAAVSAGAVADGQRLAAARVNLAAVVRAGPGGSAPMRIGAPDAHWLTCTDAAEASQPRGIRTGQTAHLVVGTLAARLPARGSELVSVPATPNVRRMKAILRLDPRHGGGAEPAQVAQLGRLLLFAICSRVRLTLTAAVLFIFACPAAVFRL
jgi:hypothetical protein